MVMSLTCPCDCHGQVNPCKHCVYIKCEMTKYHLAYLSKRSNSSVSEKK